MTNESTMEQTIRLNAYLAWLDAGRTGDAESHWLAAERDLRIPSKSAAARKPKETARSRTSAKVEAKPRPSTKSKRADASSAKAGAAVARARKIGSGADAIGAAG